MNSDREKILSSCLVLLCYKIFLIWSKGAQDKGHAHRYLIIKQEKKYCLVFGHKVSFFSIRLARYMYEMELKSETKKK